MYSKHETAKRGISERSECADLGKTRRRGMAIVMRAIAQANGSPYHRFELDRHVAQAA